MSNQKFELATLQLINQAGTPSSDEIAIALRSDLVRILPSEISGALAKCYEFASNPYINDACGSEKVFAERAITEIRHNLKGVFPEVYPFFDASKCA